MRWTREPLYKTSGWFNQEPLTTLDETLRFPTALDEIYRLAYEEYGISVRKKEIKIHNGYIYFRPFSDYIFQVITQPQFYSKLPNLFSQLGQARENFDQLVKEFLEELDTVRKVDLKILSNKNFTNTFSKPFASMLNGFLNLAVDHTPSYITSANHY